MDYELYQAYRGNGKPALAVYNAFKKAERKRVVMRDMPRIPSDGVVATTMGVIIFDIIKGMMDGMAGVWVRSPSGRTVRELPPPIALRVIRKKHWNFAITEPIKPVKIITRKAALRILFFGGEMYKEMTARRQ